MAPERIRKWGGAPIRCKAPGKNCFGRTPPLQYIVVLVSAFVMVSTFGQFLVCCSFTRGVPPVSSHL